MSIKKKKINPQKNRFEVGFLGGFFIANPGNNCEITVPVPSPVPSGILKAICIYSLPVVHSFHTLM
jgi:hypothetical protein